MMFPFTANPMVGQSGAFGQQPAQTGAGLVAQLLSRLRAGSPGVPGSFTPIHPPAMFQPAAGAAAGTQAPFGQGVPGPSGGAPYQNPWGLPGRGPGGPVGDSESGDMPPWPGAVVATRDPLTGKAIYYGTPEWFQYQAHNGAQRAAGANPATALRVALQRILGGGQGNALGHGPVL